MTRVFLPDPSKNLLIGTLELLLKSLTWGKRIIVENRWDESIISYSAEIAWFPILVRNRRINATLRRVDLITVMPVTPRVLHVVVQNELIHSGDHVKVPFPGNVSWIARLRFFSLKCQYFRYLFWDNVKLSNWKQCAGKNLLDSNFLFTGCIKGIS